MKSRGNSQAIATRSFLSQREQGQTGFDAVGCAAALKRQKRPKWISSQSVVSNRTAPRSKEYAGATRKPKSPLRFQHSSSLSRKWEIESFSVMLVWAREPGSTSYLEQKLRGNFFVSFFHRLQCSETVSVDGTVEDALVIHLRSPAKVI